MSGIAMDADNSLPKGYIVAEENEWYCISLMVS
jgi:hypothetical protein